MDDRVEIRNLQLLLYCGVLPEEQARRQLFSFDFDIYLQLADAGASDELGDTVDYGDFVTRVEADLARSRFQLVEALASRVSEVLLEDSRVDAATVTARKIRPPLPNHVDSVGVRIHRVAAGSTG